MTLLQMSLSGALMILVIAGFRFLLQQRIHRNVWLFLWIAAALRLLIPFSLPAATSIYNLPVFHAEPTIPQGAAPVENLSAAAASPVHSIDLLTLIWLIGAALTLLIVLSNHIYHLRHYRFSLPCDAPLPPMPKRVRVRTLENLDAPLTYGIFKPTILLPSSFPLEDTQRLGHVLQHELSHIRNWDILTKLVLITAAAVHWFNPFVWLMVFLASQDMEMRSDAQAIAMMDHDRIAYAKSLIAAEEDRLYSILQAGFSQNATKRRILALSKDRAVPVLSGVVFVVAFLLLGAVFMTGQAEAAQNEVLPPAAVEEVQEPTPEVIPEPQEEEIVAPAEEPEELPAPEEVTEEEETTEEPAEEETEEAETEESVAEEAAPAEPEQVTQTQSTYTPPAPEPVPQLEMPDLHFSFPDLPNNYYTTYPSADCDHGPTSINDVPNSPIAFAVGVPSDIDYRGMLKQNDPWCWCP